MLYHLLVPLARDHIVFNVFRYITFRAAMATVTALIISFVLGPWLIGRLRQMQQGGETIREDTRSGTARRRARRPWAAHPGGHPRTTLLWANLRTATCGRSFSPRRVWAHRVPGRLAEAPHAQGRLGGRSSVPRSSLVGLILAWLFFWPVDGFTTGSRSLLQGVAPDARLAWIPFALLVIVGVNAEPHRRAGWARHRAHRDDGGAFAIIAYLTGNFRAAEYLRILNVKGTGELTIFCGALVGAALGFLWFNTYPAQVFMGDVGSLALGGAIGTLAVLTKAELLLPLIGGIYVVEAGSVIIQVAWFKLTGRRVFRMAPLHHHYELCGWAEPKIIVRFWIVSFMLALLALTTLKLR